MPTTKPMTTIIFDDDLYERIEDFRFENRFQSRSKAVVYLIKLGLEAAKSITPPPISKIDDHLIQVVFFLYIFLSFYNIHITYYILHRAKRSTLKQTGANESKQEQNRSKRSKQKTFKICLK